MTNQEKKDWLSRYWKLNLRIERDLEELERMHSLAEKVTPVLSGLPKSSGDGSGIASCVERIVSLQEEIDAEVNALVDTRREVISAINTVKDLTLHILLEYRYLDGKTWEQIAVKMNYSWRQTLRRHGDALNKVVIECHTQPVI